MALSSGELKTKTRKFLLLPLIVIIALSFIPALSILHASAFATIVQETSVTKQSATTSALAAFGSPVTSGNTVVVVVGGFGCSLAFTINDTLGSTYNLVVSKSGSGSMALAIYESVLASSGADTVGIKGGGGCYWNFALYELSGVASVMTSSSGTAALACGCSVTSMNLLNGITIVGAVADAASYSGQAWTQPTGYTCTINCNTLTNSSGAMTSSYKLSTTGSSTLSMSLSGSDSPWNEVAVSFDASPTTPCQIYACQTSSYTLTWSNVTSISSPCTTSTTVSTFPYDSTSTVETLTQGSGAGCATRTQTDVQVETFTDVSTSWIVDTTTSTSTIYQINAPNPSQATYWLFPLIFIGLGIAITLGGFGFVNKQSNIGTMNEKTLIVLTLLGCVIGSAIGVGAGLVNFVFPILFTVILIIYLVMTR